MNHIVKNIRKAMMLWLMALPLQVAVARSGAPEPTVPEAAQGVDTRWVRDSFVQLMNNYKEYNRYNDSIRLINDREEWVNFFDRRALKNKEIFESNREVIRRLDRYYGNRVVEKPHVMYEALHNEIFAALGEQLSDPFLTLHIEKMLKDYYESGKCADKDNRIMDVLISMGVAANNAFTLGNDTAYAQMAYDYMKACLDEERLKNYHDFYHMRLRALHNLSTLSFFQKKVQPYEELKEQMELFARIMRFETDTTGMNLFTGPNDYKMAKTRLQRYEENLVRNAYIPGLVDLPKAYADSLMQVLLTRYEKAGKLPLRDELRMYLILEKMGKMTFTETAHAAMKSYEEVWESKYSKGELKPTDLSNYITPFFTLFFLIDKADMSQEEKHDIVLRLCQDIEDAYKRRSNQQYNTDYIGYLHTLTTYERVTKYLSPEERIHFLMELNVSTQVSTYAHSVHVGELAKIVVGGMAQHRPDLLVGLLGCHSSSAVKKNRQRFEEFVYEASIYHDLGKNSIIQLVTNEYRPLFRDETALVNRHPELGLQYLELAPQLAQYRDIMLGHHKWYNGMGGYPESFDNTQSPYRMLIDIVAFCDALQLATEHTRRNIKKTKTFDSAYEDFRRTAGTIYNPDIFELIDAQPAVAEALRQSIATGWRSIYYDIYSQFLIKQ